MINDWIWGNEPHTTAKYPQIEIKVADNPTKPISIGPEYIEEEDAYLNIYFYTKNGYKVDVNGITYRNAQLVEYYLGQIHKTLKSDNSSLFCSGAKDYKKVNSSTIEYDFNTQLYWGYVTIFVRFFQI